MSMSPAEARRLREFEIFFLFKAYFIVKLPMGCKSMDGNYLENHQTEPDIKIFNEYEKLSKGKDQQLEAAVNALLKDIRQ